MVYNEINLQEELTGKPDESLGRKAIGSKVMITK